MRGEKKKERKKNVAFHAVGGLYVKKKKEKEKWFRKLKFLSTDSGLFFRYSFSISLLLLYCLRVVIREKVEHSAMHKSVSGGYKSLNQANTR